MFLLRKNEEMNWTNYAKHFDMSSSLLSDLPIMERISKLSEYWLKRQQFPLWRRLGEILYKCCGDYVDEIRLVMSDIQKQVIGGKILCIVNFTVIYEACMQMFAWLI